jgi:hypothetical protein
MPKRLFKHTITLEECLAEETRQLREKARLLPPGSARDSVLQRIRQNETPSHVSE